MAGVLEAAANDALVLWDFGDFAKFFNQYPKDSD